MRKQIPCVCHKSLGGKTQLEVGGVTGQDDFDSISGFIEFVGVVEKRSRLAGQYIFNPHHLQAVVVEPFWW